jgi:hypothetical protein
LSHLKGVLLPRVEHVSLSSANDLCDARKPPEGRRIENSIPIALEAVPLILSGNTMAPPGAVRL